MSSVSNVSSLQQYNAKITAQPPKVDSDGDNDTNQSSKVEAKEKQPKPVSETIGNNINTTA